MLNRLSVLLAAIIPSNEKGRKSLLYRGEKCLNCNHPLDKSDKYCPNCSQLNSTKKLYFKDLFQEFFSGIFAYDSRLVNTLRVLLFKPGKISKEYVEGKRMRYANPFRFYLSVSIIFFLLSGILTKISEYTQKNEIKEKRSPKVKTFEKDSFETADSILKVNQMQLPIIHTSLSEKEALKKDSVLYYTETQLDTMYWGQIFYNKWRIYNDYFSNNIETDPQSALAQIGHQNNTYNRWLFKKIIDFNFFKDNPEVAYSYFISKLPFVIFLFMPVFALCIKFIYIRNNRITYMEHLIFAFHVQSLLFALLIITLIFDYFFNSNLSTFFALLLFAVYLYKAMRIFYQQSRFKTIVKFMTLNTLFSILATFAAILYAFLSFSLY
ncbi:MAG: hypothetical protein COZ75_11540 [Flavobacteriaceae bacterium CG_4_8_14_3_um_filter_34_10]|nr:MAG: hypothetical protein COW66_04645 [Flavobacteriaceae bacterium CG18_big_fil_WC_8_21_14_2_50_34_36]PIV49244.1 MAG: hypothetical protein COS19_09670 [Flavobacteriaceae bacterium CG02_land_8_20_14_3_00_34_13]PIX08538.1 MAG: hypothetical protein COZ75_11540 [Flavobacteriaceae bacterium CG_4_8_14_3_um_filter_34_10]PIZ08357.1 MAG: hypothetical protein COY56_04345 [Flavobacteriaceae bacterium CG_4_10_14_0_8_um_filter_34_31]PJC06727.1 MAG: hypothetical protein CO068_09765 [Flavobacteriaceae bact